MKKRYTRSQISTLNDKDCSMYSKAGQKTEDTRRREHMMRVFEDFVDKSDVDGSIDKFIKTKVFKVFFKSIFQKGKETDIPDSDVKAYIKRSYESIEKKRQGKGNDELY